MVKGRTSARLCDLMQISEAESFKELYSIIVQLDIVIGNCRYKFVSELLLNILSIKEIR